MPRVAPPPPAPLHRWVGHSCPTRGDVLIFSGSDTLVRHGTMYSSARFSIAEMQRTAEYDSTELVEVRRPCRTGVSDPPSRVLYFAAIFMIAATAQAQTKTWE